MLLLNLCSPLMIENWQHKEMTNEELKKLVRDVYDGITFTSLQCGDHVLSVFMPVIFFGAAPSSPKTSKDNQVNRRNKLQYIEDCLTYEKETPAREKFIGNIGMLYEDMSKTGPTSINGYPVFFSCKIVSKEDGAKFIEMYNKYIEMREEFEKEWKAD